MRVIAMGMLRIPRKQGTKSSQRKHDYVYHPSFDAPGAEAAILAATPGMPYWASAPGWLPFTRASALAGACGDTPLLSTEQEVHLFRKMNYLLYRAGKLRAAHAHAWAADLDEIARLQQEALAVKNQLIRANLRLVVALAKRQVGWRSGFSELVSDGNLALIRAVEKFDFSRGFRFSTYATRAIVRAFARTVPRDRIHHCRFVTVGEQVLETVAQQSEDDDACESDPRTRWETVSVMFGRLNGREQQVLTSRYGLEGASVQTLAQLGRVLGLTRERVRQIELQAHKKLRKLVLDELYGSTPKQEPRQ
jgi:RNA polymerase primary sigma factor